MKNQPLAKLIARQEVGRTRVGVYKWDNDGVGVTIVGIMPENDAFIPLSAHCGEGDERALLFERQNENNRPELCDIDGEVMIAILNRERSEILSLIFLADEVAGTRRHEAQRLHQKKRAAEFFGVEHFKLDREELKLYEREQGKVEELEELVTVPVARPAKSSHPVERPANPVISADVVAVVAAMQPAATTVDEVPALDPEKPIRDELLSREIVTVYAKSDGSMMKGIRVISGDHLRLLPDGTECVKIDERGHGHYFVIRGGKQREHVAVTTNIITVTGLPPAEDLAPTQLH